MNQKNNIRFHWMHRYSWGTYIPGLVEMSKTLEENNVYSVLLPYGHGGVEYFFFVRDLINATKNIKFMFALRAYMQTPEYAEKLFKTAYIWQSIEFRSSTNRLALNLVAGNLSKEEEAFVVENMAGDPSFMDTHDKRVQYTKSWLEKFVGLCKEHKPELYMVGSSDTTVDIANEYSDYLIITERALNHDLVSKIKDTGIVLAIDPLIRENPDDLNSAEYFTEINNRTHLIKGSMEEVISQIKKISEEFGIYDFMIHTDQKDISQILQLVKIMSQK